MKRKFSKEVIRSRVRELLELVRLPDIADRSPKRLSGGQQQRVALARALAVQPAVLLLDEPLASLDKKLREEMQVELRRLHEKVGATTIFVTHNQREAMTMSDRIAVMNAGRIEQVGDPIEIYRDPANRFVADFIGASNLFAGRVKRVEAERAWIAINDRWIITCDRTEGLSEAQSVYVCIRPEDIILGGSSEITGTITFKRHLGSVVEYYIAVGQGMEICATAQGRKEEYKEGMRVSIAIDPRYVKVLKD